MADELEEIARLRDDLDVQLQGYEEGQRALGSARASDASRMVEAQLSADGVLDAVHVDGAWRQRLDPAELSGAVLEAYAAAAQTRSNAWYVATADAEPARARPEDGSGRRLADGLLESMTERGRDLPPSLLLAMDELLDDLDRSVDRAFGMVDDRLDAAHRGRSSSGHVTATVSGAGEITAIEYDEGWLETAHSFNIGRETTEAVHDATRAGAGQVGDTIADASGLTRLHDLTTDPASLSRFLGLDG